MNFNARCVSLSSIALLFPVSWILGGYSQSAYEKRFTESSIERVKNISRHLSGVKITNGDYTNTLFQDGDDVFIFLDPPYWKATGSKLYGVRGELHTTFDHAQFAENMKKCPHKWLITYDDSHAIRELFDFAEIQEVDAAIRYEQLSEEECRKRERVIHQKLLSHFFKTKLPYTLSAKVSPATSADFNGRT